MPEDLRLRLLAASLLAFWAIPAPTGPKAVTLGAFRARFAHILAGQFWMGSEKGEYPSGPVTDPIGPESGEYRVLRGGSWVGGAWYLRSAFRDGYTPGNRFSLIGFRVARDLN